MTPGALPRELWLEIRARAEARARRIWRQRPEGLTARTREEHPLTHAGAFWERVALRAHGYYNGTWK